MGLLKVIKPGFYTTIQDAGRMGFRKYGVPVSGAMDAKAMEVANRLVGNKLNAPVLEYTFDGGEYEFETEAVISITGADATIKLNNVSNQRYKAIFVKSGDHLKIGHPKRGVRTYLAIRGQWQIPKMMGSYSTYVPGSFGGFDGRPLQAGDVLKWENSEGEHSMQEVSLNEIPYYSGKITLDVLCGPEWDLLNETQKTHFLNSDYLVESTSNRMAIRFSGEGIETSIPDMKSSAVAPGVIQLPPSGIPILLMKDAQTVGGYPRILHISGVQLWRVGQLAPGTKVRFRLQQ